MDRKSIKYVGFYDFPNSKSNRVCNLAATNKMDYIASAINRAGYDVEIISPSWMGDNSNVRFERQNTVIVDQGVSVTFCPSWITKNKITRNIKIVFSLLWLFFYLILNVKRNEKILAYHVQWISIPIRAAKFIKGFELILEVEEIYQDVLVFNSFFPIWENKLIEAADKYIFSTELLISRLGIEKPFVIIYGAYNIQDKICTKNNDGKIHLVYAGIIDSHKKGAFNALEASKYLTERYHLHIIGFGEIETLKDHIKKHNKANKCKITYDGVLSGADYISFLQSCHIGLSTQTMEGEYLQTSFPSKVLSYLSLGLRVVSCYVDCVRKSKIGEIITYYYNDQPNEIAEAIMSIDINSDYDSITLIKKLDKQFIKDIKELLEDKDATIIR